MKKIENFLSSRYEFYLNVFSGQTCYKRLNAENEPFQPITDYDFNSLYREMKNEDVGVYKDDLKSILHSNFIPKINPFIQFLETIEPCNDGVDYITKIASSVTTTNNEFLHWVFKKWFVGVVAGIFTTKDTNENMLILLGKQGIGKTRWLESLLPEELSEYYFSGDIDPSNKDHLALFSSKIIINLDELTSFKRSKIAAFKSLLSQKKTTLRRAYGVYNQDFKRIASVVGTSNHKDVLMDTSGNRRYLCIEALELNKIDEQDLKKAYKQAYELYQSGFKHFFNNTEIDEINAVNMDYMQANEETDIISKYFEICDTDHPSALFMNATEVLQYLNTTCQESTKISVSILGRILNDFGFKTKKSNGTKRYALLLKQSSESVQGKETVQSEKEHRENLLNNITIPMHQNYLQIRN